MAKVTAIIDIGSNSARMAIFEKTSHLGFHLLYETKSKVRISENTYMHKGFLQEEPMNRAILALKGFLHIAKNHKAKKILCVATSALRDAPNKDIFLKKAWAIGLNIKVINGEKEAYFGAVAALNLLPYESGITLDIGGGSTEFALIEKGKILHQASLNIGTIRLKELFLDKKDFQGAKNFIEEKLKELPKEYQHKRIFAIGGTSRALSKAIQKRENYPLDTLHSYEYCFLTQKDFLDSIYSAKQDELRSFGIKEDRLDCIQGGALIFKLALEKFHTQEIITSGVGVREGVFLCDILRNLRHKFPVNFNPSIRNIKDRFIKNQEKSKITKKLANRILLAQKKFNLISDDFFFHLSASAELCDAGTSLNFYEKNHHCSYLLFNGLNYALTHKDRLIISILAKYSGKKIPTSLEPYAFLLPPLRTLQILSFFLSVADCLSENPSPLDFTFSFEKSGEENFILNINHTDFSYLIKEKMQKLILPTYFHIQCP